MVDVIVIGAGFAGAVFAREMAQSGKKVLLLEKRLHIGGNMYEEHSPNGVRTHKYGPHIFHTNNRIVVEYLQKFSEWYKYEHRVLGNIEGKLVPIPINFTSIETLFSKKESNNLILALTESYGLGARVSVFDLLNNIDKNIREFGNFVFEKVFKNYTAKQWGIPAKEVDKSTINRVPIVIGYDDRYFSDTFQIMPKNGFTYLFKNILEHPNIEIQLNTDVTSIIELDNNEKKVYIYGNLFKGPILYSASIDELLSFEFGGLAYRTLSMKFEEHEKEFFQSNAVINYPNEEDFTRITEFKYLTGQKNTQTTILKEYPLFCQNRKLLEPYYPISNIENNAVYAKYLEILKLFSNIFLCGRLAEYKYYNMDQVIERSLKLAKYCIEND